MSLYISLCIPHIQPPKQGSITANMLSNELQGPFHMHRLLRDYVWFELWGYSRGSQGLLLVLCSRPTVVLGVFGCKASAIFFVISLHI